MFGRALRQNARLALAVVLSAVQVMPVVAQEVDWPLALKPFGPGYPQAGDPCRQLRESQVTTSYLDDGALLIGCPGTRSSAVVKQFLAANGGSVVAVIDDFALISVPLNTRANVGLTGHLRCGRNASRGMAACPFEVVRNARINSGSLTVTRPDGGKRTLYFANGKIGGGDTNAKDGSAKYRVIVTKELSQYVVAIGEERYEVPLSVVGAE